jgi:hypothetical protein
MTADMYRAKLRRQCWYVWTIDKQQSNKNSSYKHGHCCHQWYYNHIQINTTAVVIIHDGRYS